MSKAKSHALMKIFLYSNVAFMKRIQGELGDTGLSYTNLIRNKRF